MTPERAAALRRYCRETGDDEPMCSTCNGSGESRGGGGVCRDCRGRGVLS